MAPTQVAILGGGLAGLQTARLLTARKVSCHVLEGRGVVGGLCRTIKRGAWSWDIGPHAFYSKQPEIMRNYEELPLAYGRFDRRVRVAHGHEGKLLEVGYPFENGLADLPNAQRWECLLGALKAKAFGERPYRNLAHWIDNGLGSGIGRRFMIPYNRKIWSCPIEQVSMDLVKGKIEPEPAWKIVRNAFVSGTVGRQYQASFIYPRGGAGGIPEAVAKACGSPIDTGWSVASLKKDGGAWTVTSSDGRELQAKRVVSTIPIPVLLKALGGAAPGNPSDFLQNDTYMTAIGLKEGRRFGPFGDCHWVFFAGPETFYRLTFMNTMDPSRLPVVVAETTRKPETPDEAAITQRVLKDLIGAGIVASESDVGMADTHLEACTYPLQTVGMPEKRAALEAKLEAMGIFLLGRSGRWDYVNTDGIFARAEGFAKTRAAGLLKA